MQGIDVGDAQRVADQASGSRTAAGAHRNILRARVANEIPDDQEISGVAHLLDHLDFVREALLVFGQRTPQEALLGGFLEARQSFGEAFASDALEIAVDCEALGHLELGERVAHRLDAEIAALGDSHGARESFREFSEYLGHFLGSLEIKLVGGEAHAMGVGHGFAGLDAHQHFLGAGVGARQVVAIVGGHQGNAALARQAHQLAIERLIHVQALVLHLEEKIAFAENVLKAVGRGARVIVALLQHRFGNGAFEAGGERD